MLQRRGLVLLVPGFQTGKYDAVGALAVKPYLPVFPKDHGHATSGVVEVQNAKKLVHFDFTHYFDRHAVWRSFFEDDTEIPGRRDKSRFVR